MYEDVGGNREHHYLTPFCTQTNEKEKIYYFIQIDETLTYKAVLLQFCSDFYYNKCKKCDNMDCVAKKLKECDIIYEKEGEVSEI